MKKDKLEIVDEKAFKKAQKDIDKKRKNLESKKSKIENEIRSKKDSSSKAILFKDRKDEKIEALRIELDEIHDKLTGLDERQRELNQLKAKNTKKVFILSGMLLVGAAIIVLIMVLIGQAASSNENETTVTSSITDYSQTTVVSTTSETLKDVELTPSMEKWSVEVGETDDYISYRFYPSLLKDEIDKYELAVEVDNPDVLSAELKFFEGDILHIVIAGIKPGKAEVTIVGKDGKVNCKAIAVTVREPETEPTTSNEPIKQEYVLNTNTKKIHNPSCSAIGKMSKKNKKEVVGTVDEYISQGYTPCGQCNPK